MKKLALLSIALLSFILALWLTSCNNASTGGGQGTSGNDTAVTSSETETTAPAVTEEPKPDLPEDVDFTGQEFKILSRKGSGAYASFTNYELFSEGYNSDLINDAIYDRNLAVEEKYGIVITQAQYENPATQLQTSIAAEDHAYDVMVTYQTNMSTAATNGLLYSLFELPYIDLEMPWWDRNSVEGFSIANELYFAASDWLLLDKQRTLVLYFNKEMATDFQLGNIYQMVIDGTWTIDRMNEMILKVSEDLNGNGTVDLDDRFGIVHTSNDGFTTMFLGSENRLTVKDEDDLPVLNLYTEHANETVDKLIAMLRGNKKTSLFPTDWQTNYGSYSSYWSIPSGIFNAGRALFHAAIAYSAQGTATNADFEFGIIPFPKFSEEQEKYYTNQAPQAASAIGVPMNNDKLEMTGVLLEELSYQSMKSVMPVYYEEWLKVRYTTDQESAAMLDILFDNIVYDLGIIYDWGGVWQLIKTTVGGSSSNNFASAYASKESAILTAMQNTIDAFSNK